MKLPRDFIKKNCKYPNELDIILNNAERTIKTWQPSWSKFLSAPVREEAIQFINNFNELNFLSSGGYKGAERQRLYFTHSDQYQTVLPIKDIPIIGISLIGNFLFDKATSEDFRDSLKTLNIPSGEIGDIWVLNDRGAQALCTPEAAQTLNGAIGKVRDIDIECQVIDLESLKFPPFRVEKRFFTIEASTRIDAISSAGFGLSRAKIVRMIKEGRLRRNWNKVKQAGQEVVVGDRIQLENKGSIKILGITLTKRQRWRVELLRH